MREKWYGLRCTSSAKEDKERYDVMTSDTKAAEAFYRSVVGCYFC
jgi:hypothetical protein